MSMQVLRKIRLLLMPALLLLILGMADAQPSTVSLTGDSVLAFPWAGGMNSMQFGEVDINRDGIMDLVAFDRQGNRMMPFINGGGTWKIDYLFDANYIDNFPVLYDWAIFADYNNDGKADIFTYSPGWAGMMVYKNVSDETLKFERVVYPYLTSLNSGGEINILVTYADYPAITDLDNDGDLDILTFWGLGSFVEMHKNLSMEEYGNADSLIFEKTEECWGNFAESDESNELFLDTCVPAPLAESNRITNRQERHTGSTFLMLDLDGDNDKDLLLGDVDYPGLFALTNGGTPEQALITSYDTAYPDESQKIRIFSMPAAAYIDVNNDGKKDLIVSPFDPATAISKNHRSVMLYLNHGENNHPGFQLATESFLQDQMIDVGSGSMPVFFDWDSDGFTDLFIGNYGYYKGSWYDQYFTLHSQYRGTVFYLKNTGTWGYPVFTPVDMDFGKFLADGDNLVGVAPAFGDVNGDGNNDMLVGNSNGTLTLVEFSGTNVTKQQNYAGIDVGAFSAPQLFDLDNDGLLDLIVGEQDGNLNYFHNNGTVTNADFVLKTDSLGKVNVTDYTLSYYGYSYPAFYRGHDGKTVLVVGSQQGKLFYYENIDGNLTGTFTESDQLGTLLGLDRFNPDRGMRTAATLSDVCVGSAPELMAGNFSGGVELFGGNAEVLASAGGKKASFGMLTVFPNPADDKVFITIPLPLKQYTMQITDFSGRLIYYKAGASINKGTMEIDVRKFNPGMYVISVASAGAKYEGKLLIIR